MKDESWKDVKGIPENVRFVLEDVNSNILWNYITNLQEEKDDYKHKFWEEQELNEYLQDKIDKVAGRAMHIQKTYGYELSDLIFLLQGKSDE